MNIFWDPTITFSRQKSGVFILRKLPIIFGLFRVLLHPGCAAWISSPGSTMNTAVCVEPATYGSMTISSKRNKSFVQRAQDLPFHSWNAPSPPWLPWNLAVLRAALLPDNPLKGQLSYSISQGLQTVSILVHPTATFKPSILHSLT